MHPASHGYYELHFHQDFLLAQLYDSWNVTTTNEYRKDIKHTVGQLEQQPWAAIFDIRDWQFLTPESIPVMQKQIGWCLQNQLCHCIYLAPDSGILEYLKQQAHAQVTEHNCKFVQVATVEECLTTLENWQVNVPKPISALLQQT
ncbi:MULTISPECIES: hypothetical protein [unclassified Agarivorans]|uniref:hypothetical protein n=1 Tax=unclassified Agarivorans TaxID=2636026 RepID=UPI0026E12438|nr:MULTISPECIES: hypothetical protein [unclassified Agarivorans]MDO6685584.1 hypothetical protein [Agarivorans sp. 3_MG-2023]MDO6715970.1 hypothetical protein [Agarivorans sp. 2_MG-2023]